MTASLFGASLFLGAASGIMIMRILYRMKIDRDEKIIGDLLRENIQIRRENKLMTKALKSMIKEDPLILDK